MIKKKVLICIGGYLPGEKSGGPVRSVSNLVKELNNKCSFYILTKDRDIGENKPYKNVSINKWMQIENAKIYYLQNGQFQLSKLILFSKNVDVVYILGIFNIYTFKILILNKLGIISPKVIIASTGSLSHGAISLKKMKKKTYLYLCNILGLYKNVYFSATSEEEKNNIKEFILQYKAIFIARDISSHIVMKSRKNKDKKKDCLDIVFLSRISRKKNLDFAIKCLQSLKGQINFHIYGILEDLQYWNECQNQLKQLPENVNWQYRGAVDSNSVLDTLSNEDLFFFPTKGENYGHVIIEALAAGCPIIISDQTPWTNLKSKKVGGEIKLSSTEQFSQELQKYVDMDTQEFEDVSKNAYEYAKRFLEDKEPLSMYERMFV